VLQHALARRALVGRQRVQAELVEQSRHPRKGAGCTIYMMARGWRARACIGGVYGLVQDDRIQKMWTQMVFILPK
jgi:hypothetical protein